ncbi:MAG: sigma-70 family RNA polymerase sigma factor [Vicinamibacteria bacterium]|nr:sigma-70 family RNA polymerase sigma factor [Vicinamibacteria bacterium]
MTEPDATQTELDHLFRHHAGQMVATLCRIFGFDQLAAVEDAVQDALLLALRRWPFQGRPDNPRAWLIQVAKNRLLDRLRRAKRWQRREAELERAAAAVPGFEAADAAFAGELRDDALALVFACCHPALPAAAQVALTLKTACGFAVPEVARAFLVGEEAMAQRLVRARQRLREASVALEIPAAAELAPRREAALAALYLMFNEGYAPQAGDDVVREDVCREAIRLAELLADHPATAAPEADALCALLLFQASRLRARRDAAGELLLFAEQDPGLWDLALVARGVARLRASARGERLTAYHLEAEIAGLHAAPERGTDWGQIVHLYDLLLELRASPVVALNRAIALGQRDGPQAGLDAVEALGAQRALRAYAPRHAARGFFLARLGRGAEAAAAWEEARALTSNEPLRRFLARQRDRAREG